MILRKCQYCGKEFEAHKCYLKRGGGKYCSRSCYYLSMKVGIKKIVRICEYCKKEFFVKISVAKSGGGKFCSVLCHNRSMNKKNCCICNTCGKNFYKKQADVKKGRGKYCSKKCFTQSQIKRITKRCLQCGKEFTTLESLIKIGNGKFCSQECAHKWSSINGSGENSSLWKGGSKGRYKRQKHDIKYQLNQRMKNMMNAHLKNSTKNGRKWENLVVYNLNDLIKHLKKTLPNGYNWKDFLEGKLHIDHEIPISAYSFDKPEDFQFQECWSLNNLQFLPAKENLKKGSKLIKPFQTSLRI